MAVVLMPPTLIASIYGMNFKDMPELDWTHGYPLALVAMLAAAVVPYLIFKWKKCCEGSAVILRWCASTRPQMRNCASGNLEIPGSPLRGAPE